MRLRDATVGRLWTGLWLLGLALVVVVTACDEVTEVGLTNERNTAIVYRGAIRDVTLQPGETMTIGHLPGKDLTLVIETPDGSAVFDGVVPWERLKALDFDLVVAESGIGLETTR